ncbi:MAG: transcription termination/antitermination protein NusA [Proteobacteria bacterium]|nr:transcription termination/antitermination protein NusA [Pseudomonadota bacterium]
MASRKLKPIESHQAQQPRHELLQVADVVAREKGIDREEVLVAMEYAIQKAAKAKYGHEHDIRVLIHRQTGDVSLVKYQTVVEEVQNDFTELTLEEAKKINPQAEIGDTIETPLPPIEFGRVAAQTARQVILQRVREAERSRQYDEFKDRVGQIISGLVKRIEFGNVILDLGRAEGILKRDEIIPRETFRIGDRIRVYVYDVKPEVRGAMVFLSRTHPQFLAKLFEQEVPEIYDSIIEIKSVARDPGSRAKMAIYTADPTIDPVGACVGMRGTRVQAVVNELQGEKIDIVPWSSNIATFVVNALAPAEAAKVVINEEEHRVDVIVAEDQLSLAIGRRGQNVKLASQLTGWNIDILTEEQEAARRSEEYTLRTKLFMEALDVDEMVAQLLAAEGFATLEEVAMIPSEEFASIEGFDEEIAQEIQNRAVAYLHERDQKDLIEARHLGLAKNLEEFKGLTPNMLYKLVQQGVKTLDDFADLAGDELLEIIGKDYMTQEQANELIMAARAHWF